jgi:hypothetical protein
MSLNALLKNKCTIFRPNDTFDAGEIVKGTPTTVKANQRCLLQEKPGAIVHHESGKELRYDATLFLPKNADIKPQSGDDVNDSIQMTGNKSGFFEVLWVGDLAGNNHHLEAKLKRIRKAD